MALVGVASQWVGNLAIENEKIKCLRLARG